MNLVSIAYKTMRHRWLASFLTGLSVALGVALTIAVLILNNAIANVFTATGSGYDLVVGAKGSDLQLVLSTIYRMDKPIANLPWSFYEYLRNHPSVERAIPVNIGDTTEEGDFPIVGTTPRYFTTEYIPGKKFQFYEGSRGLEDAWDAVVGSQVAKVNGWKIGSEFKLVHAGQDDHVHDEKFTVRGILAPTGTPNDRTAFVALEGFFALAGHGKPIGEAIQREAKFYGKSEADIREQYKDEIAPVEAFEKQAAAGGHAHYHGQTPDLQKEVTGVFLVMKGDRSGYEPTNRALSMQQRIKLEHPGAMATNPVSVMAWLLTNLIGNVRLAFLILTALIIVVSGIGIFVSIYNSMSDRKKEIAVMRALGAKRQTVFSIVLIESLLLCVLGGLAGLILGHGLVFVAAPLIESRSGLLIDPLTFSPQELIILPVLMVLSTLVGFLPGLTAYRTDVADSLQG